MDSSIFIPSSKNKNACEIFPLAKAQKLPLISAYAHAHASFSFQLIYMDIRVLPMITNKCTKYFLLIVDDFNKYQWIYFCKAKSDVKTIFQSFIQMAERNFNTKIIFMQTYGYLEFSCITTLLYHLSVMHRKTCPHISE